MKILIADDDRVIHISFTKPLVNSGYEVISAYDGQEAFDMAVDQKPDIIILDLGLPKMDGRDVCKNLKESPQTEHIKILMFTGKDQDHDRRLGLELGADDYISKPCSISFLERSINKIVRDI